MKDINHIFVNNFQSIQEMLWYAWDQTTKLSKKQCKQFFKGVWKGIWFLKVMENTQGHDQLSSTERNNNLELLHYVACFWPFKNWSGSRLIYLVEDLVLAGLMSILKLMIIYRHNHRKINDSLSAHFSLLATLHCISFFFLPWGIFLKSVQFVSKHHLLMWCPILAKFICWIPWLFSFLYSLPTNTTKWSLLFPLIVLSARTWYL